MLMLILVLEHVIRKKNSLNTSYVNVNQPKHLVAFFGIDVSIHPMLMLIDDGWIRAYTESIVSIHPMLMLILIYQQMLNHHRSLNTSYVNVNLYHPPLVRLSCSGLNTSYVNVNL